MLHIIWYHLIWFILWFDVIQFQLFIIYQSLFEIWGHQNKDINMSHTLIMRFSCPCDFIVLQLQWLLARLTIAFAWKTLSVTFLVQCVIICALAPGQRRNLCSSGIEAARGWHVLESIALYWAAWDPIGSWWRSGRQPETFNFLATSRRSSSATPSPYEPAASITSSRRAVIEIRGRAHNRGQLW